MMNVELHMPKAGASFNQGLLDIRHSTLFKLLFCKKSRVDSFISGIPNRSVSRDVPTFQPFDDEPGEFFVGNANDSFGA